MRIRIETCDKRVHEFGEGCQMFDKNEVIEIVTDKHVITFFKNNIVRMMTPR